MNSRSNTAIRSFSLWMRLKIWFAQLDEALHRTEADDLRDRIDALQARMDDLTRSSDTPWSRQGSPVSRISSDA